jgi:hypothetical protein
LIQKTIHQATLEEREFEQKQEDDFQRAKEEMKQEVLAPIFAKYEYQSLAKILGDGESGQKAAAIVTAVRNDLPLPRFCKETAKTGLPSVPSVAALAKEEALAKAGQTQSTLVKPPSDSLTPPPPPPDAPLDESA